NIDTIEAQHSLNKIRKKSKQSIHWHVDLKTTIEEFNQTLSQHTRRNTKWYPKKIKGDFGEYNIKHYKVSDISDIVMNKFKYETHKSDYNKISPQEYLKNYYVTDGYVLYIGDDIGAMGFSNITDKNIYLENISYNQKFQKYSVGMVLYYYLIKEYINKHYDTMFLCSGTSEYKKRFNGIATSTYSGKVIRKSAYIKKISKKFWNLITKVLAN
ncbi:GNAT family N-acetyltransferase, partial [Pseudomonadota bacterium]